MLFFYLECAPTSQRQVADWVSVTLKTQTAAAQYKAPAATWKTKQVTLAKETWSSKGHDMDALYLHVPKLWMHLNIVQ